MDAAIHHNYKITSQLQNYSQHLTEVRTFGKVNLAADGAFKGMIQAITNMMNKLKLSAEQAMDILNIPKDKYEYYKSVINNA